MTVLVSLLAAAGVVTFASGLPALRRNRMQTRIEPYLSGLHGRPSTLLARPPTRALPAGARRLAALLAGALPGSHALTEERLTAAGYGNDAAAFRLEQVVWGLGATVCAWAAALVAAFAGMTVDARMLPILTILAFACGFLARDWLLTQQVTKRRMRLQEELPTAIDLMALSLLAGESVPAAFARVSDLLAAGIGVELRGVVADVRAGAPAVEALEALKQRMPVPGIARLVDALISGIERGAPLAEVLRAQAEDGREARRRSLLEIAGRREVLMLVPVVFLIMPVVVVFTLLPGLVALDLLVP